MRFTAAATGAILAQSLLPVAVDSSSSATTSTTTDVKLFESEFFLTLQQRDQERRQFNKKLQGKQGLLPQQPFSDGILKNINKEFLRECTPASSKVSSADVGVLSCGLGQYCVESSDSSTGGYCVSQTTRLPGRRRQQVVGRLSIIELADLFCNRPEETGLTVDCNCTVDFGEFSGEFTCNFGPDCADIDTGCTDETFPICSAEELTANLVGPDNYSYTSCYTQTLPLSNERFYYCTDFGYTAADGPTCDIQVEGVTCNSW
jgi:hypothetical protein